jgi:hypothetical protein
MADRPAKPILNRVLSRLSAADLAHLEPHLVAADLPLRKSLEMRIRPIENVYFFERGFASWSPTAMRKALRLVSAAGKA